ncbi:hypothetical protein Tco_0685114 [Tanacetum coccineum]
MFFVRYVLILKPTYIESDDYPVTRSTLDSRKVLCHVHVQIEDSHEFSLEFLATVCAEKLPNSLESSKCWAYVFHQDKASSIRVLVANVTLGISSEQFCLRYNTKIGFVQTSWIRPTAHSLPVL